MKEVGKRLKALRESVGFSQVKIGRGDWLHTVQYQRV